MDIQSRRHWVDYSRAKDEMFAYTDTKKSPWYVVNPPAAALARRNSCSAPSRKKYSAVLTFRY